MRYYGLNIMVCRICLILKIIIYYQVMQQFKILSNAMKA